MAAVITISRRRIGIAALLLLTQTLTKQAHAQAVVPVRHTDLPIGCEVETVAPYSSWKTHRGKPEECLAVVRYGDQTCNALVVRCDGFLALPETAWQAQIDRQKLEVLVTKAEGESEVGPFPINAPVRRKTSRADYRLVKLNDHHVRSLPLLASHQLAKDTPLIVLWATVAKDSKKLVIEKRKAKFEELTEPRRGFRATLSYEGEGPKSVPSGAVVVDEASGAAVGMIADGSQPTQLSTWRFWYDIVNQVGLAPDRDAAMGKAPGSESRMVPVKGGPVRLRERSSTFTALRGLRVIEGPPISSNGERLALGQQGTYITDFGTDIVCCADFYCDINPVTNGEWINWRETLRDKPPLPETWNSVKNPPHNNPLIPICGLRYQDMEDYAALHNKRMITEVEFTRAAYTKDMSWLDRMVQSVEEAKPQVKFKLAEYALQVQQRMYEIKLQALLQKQPPPEIRVDVSDITARFQVDMDAIAQQMLAQGIVQSSTQAFPGHVHSVQFVPEDKSDAGVRQIHLNAPEACQGWNFNTVVAPKTRGSDWDPFLTRVRAVVKQDRNSSPTTLEGPLISMSFDALANLYLWAIQWDENNIWHHPWFPPGMTESELKLMVSMILGPQYMLELTTSKAYQDLVKLENVRRYQLKLPPVFIYGGFGWQFSKKAALGFRCVR